MVDPAGDQHPRKEPDVITVITGTPGAGKTLYAISKLLLPLVGTTVRQEVDGEVVEYPRTIYTNIRGLMLDHELIDGSGEGGLRNWHEWAKPGAIIVFDEVQKVWEPRPNGAKVPPDIQALETHRHMGVDFVLITQGLPLTDRNLSMLAGRHLHVRRIAAMGVAIVYEWDHASRTLMYSKAVAKHPWRYDRKVFKLYKSADLHTKQKRSVPTLMYFVLAGLVGLAVLVPTFKKRMDDRFGKPVEAAHVAPSGDARVGPVKPAGEPAAAVSGASAAPAKPDRDAVAFAGCIRLADRCDCYDVRGGQVDPPSVGFCAVSTGKAKPPPISLAGVRVPEEDWLRRRYEVARLERGNLIEAASVWTDQVGSSRMGLATAASLVAGPSAGGSGTAAPSSAVRKGS